MKVIGVILVLGAGGKKKIYLKGIRLPGILAWPWPGLKSFLNRIGVKVEFLNELKCETIATLDKTLELYEEKVIDMIFIADSYSPGRKTQGVKQVGEMMKKWLMEGEIPAEKIIVSGDSVQTRGKIQAFIDYLKQDLEKYPDAQYHVHSPVGKYYSERAISEVQIKTIKKQKNLVSILVLEKHEVKIPWRCWFSEYLFNRIFESWKRRKSEKELDEYEKEERKAREGYKIKK